MEHSTVGRYAWNQWTCQNVLAVTPATLLPQARLIAADWMSRVEVACSRFRRDSELSRIRPETETVISPVLAELLQASLHAAELTDGRVDPTMGRFQTAHGYGVSLDALQRDPDADSATASCHHANCRDGSRDPADPVSAAQLRDSGRERPAPRAQMWRQIRLKGCHLTIPANVGLDLGAVSKAWAADQIASECVGRLGGGALVSLGGDIATAGESPARDWQVLVQDLPDDPADWLALHGTGGVATSSVQHRRWLWNGRPTNHILCPVTGDAVSSRWTHVTVIASSCVEANTWSTAALVEGDDAPAFLDRHGVAARLVDRVATVHIVCNWPTDTSSRRI